MECRFSWSLRTMSRAVQRRISRIGLLAVILTFVFAVAAHAEAGGASVTLNAPPNDLGLVGHWSFDSGDVSGTTVLDQSGNGNNGTTVSDPKQIPGKLGQALSFNGSSSVVVNSFPINTLTLSAWIRTTQIVGSSGSAQIINRDTTGGNNSRDWQFRIQGSPAVPTIILFNTGGAIAGVVASTTVNDGKWHLVTATWDGATIRMYVDGKASGSPASFSGTLNSGSPLLFAEASGITGGSNFNGTIDDVRIYDRALSASDVEQLYNEGDAVHDSSPTSLVPNGLVGYWTFDGANTNWTANTTADVSGHGNTGTLVGMAPATSAVLGRVGQAYSFNGTNQYIALGNVLNFATSPYTVSMWAQHRLLAGGWYTRMFSVEGNSGTCASIATDVNNNNLISFAVNTKVGLGVSVTNASQWHYYTMTWDGTTMTVYVDGVKQGTSSATGGTFNCLSTVDIGRYAAAAMDYYSGSIDDVRIYNRALSATEVKQLYNAGAVGTTIDTAPAQALSGGGLVGYWPFDGSQMNWASNLALDASGNGNNGTLVNMTPANAVMGVIGQALSFNGTSQSVSIPTFNSTFTYCTMTAWIKPAALPSGWNGIVFSRDGLSKLGGLSFNTTNELSWNWDNNGWSWASGLYAPINQWSLVTLVITPTSATIYLGSGGKLISATDPYANPAQVLDNLYIGQDTYGGRFFNGSIDDVRIYNRALSASEVKQLYNLGR